MDVASPIERKSRQKSESGSGGSYALFLRRENTFHVNQTGIISSRQKTPRCAHSRIHWSTSRTNVWEYPIVLLVHIRSFSLWGLAVLHRGYLTCRFPLRLELCQSPIVSVEGRGEIFSGFYSSIVPVLDNGDSSVSPVSFVFQRMYPSSYGASHQHGGTR